MAKSVPTGLDRCSSDQPLRAHDLFSERFASCKRMSLIARKDDLPTSNPWMIPRRNEQGSVV